MGSAELLTNLRCLAKSENQRQLLDALEKSVLRYSIARLSHVSAITETMTRLLDFL